MRSLCALLSCLLAFYLLLHLVPRNESRPVRRPTDVREYTPLYYAKVKDNAKGVRVRFRSAGKLFDLALKPVAEPDDIVITDNGGPRKAFFYDGVNMADNNASVAGGLHEGHFVGHIHTSSGEDDYWVESAVNAFGARQPFHSIIYRGSDVIGGINIAHDAPVGKKRPKAFDGQDPRRCNEPKHIYPNRRCTVRVTVDHLMVKRFIGSNNGNELAAHDEIRQIIAAHQDGLNKLYNPLAFDDITGVSFLVVSRNFLSASEKDCNTAKNPFCQGQNPAQMLEEYAKQDHSDVCISLLYVDRERVKDDFMAQADGSVMWRTDILLQSACARFRKIFFNEPPKSMNVAFINFQDTLGNLRPTVKTTPTVCHECTHLFGARHDDPFNAPECFSQLKLMYPEPTEGRSLQLSTCSISAVQTFLKVVMSVPPGMGGGIDSVKNCFV